MGDEQAYAYVDDAIRGEVIPADQREAYNAFQIFDVGSANITVMNGANDLWHSWNHDRGRHQGILDAWHRYPTGKGKRYAYQNEVFGGVFRYRNWQIMSFVSMHCHAQLIGDSQLERDMAQVLRYTFFLAAMSAGWWKTNKTDGRGGTWAVAACGARSYVGPEDPNGGRSTPYAGICEVGGLGDDFSNLLGTRRASWELEPVIAACEQTHGYERWNMFTSEEIALLERVAKVKKSMTDKQVEDFEELARLFTECEYVSHVGVHHFKTDLGVAMACAKSHASGSTSFKLISIVVKDGVDKSEYLEPYAGDIDPQYGWGAVAPLNRKSDPGCTSGLAVYDDRVEFSFRCNAGASANGFEPGPGRHFAQWLGQSRDRDAWPERDRVITLPGKLIRHDEIRQKQAGVVLHFPTAPNQPPDTDPEDPDMAEPGSKYRLRNVARSLELIKKHDGDVDAAKEECLTDEEFQKTLTGEHDKQKEGS